MLRALGDSKTPLIFLVLASLLNIGLDLLFVLYFNMAVYGVAIATVIAQGTSAAGCMMLLPAILFIVCFEKNIMGGLMMGSIKQ